MKAPTDLRLLNLSYSSLLTLHACPRKFQLEKLNAEIQIEEDVESSITFAFGHCVGLGVQLVLENKTKEETVFQMFLMWAPDLEAVNPRQQKSFWQALAAIQSFKVMRECGLLDEWELYYHLGKPACELGFRIHLPQGYKYRGFVDAVLKNTVTGEVMVLECKTTSSSNFNPATYKNSAQAIGYSIVLDHLFPELSSYRVVYLVYNTKSAQWQTLEFTKSYLQRALWLQELLLEVNRLQLYDHSQVYPMHGESCYNFYRECKYLGTCTMATKYITHEMTEEEEAALNEKEKEGAYDVEVSFEDLVKVQLEK